MKILAVRLHNIRRYEDAEFRFDGRSTAVLGENGSGKSSILEAIVGTLSGRFPRDRGDTVRRGAGDAWSEVEFLHRDRVGVVRRSLSDPKKSFLLIDGERVEGVRQIDERLEREFGVSLQRVAGLIYKAPHALTTVLTDPAGVRLTTLQGLFGLIELDEVRRELRKTVADFSKEIGTKPDLERSEEAISIIDNDLAVAVSRRDSLEAAGTTPEAIAAMGRDRDAKVREYMIEAEYVELAATLDDGGALAGLFAGLAAEETAIRSERDVLDGLGDPAPPTSIASVSVAAVDAIDAERVAMLELRDRIADERKRLGDPIDDPSRHRSEVELLRSRLEVHRERSGGPSVCPLCSSDLASTVLFASDEEVDEAERIVGGYDEACERFRRQRRIATEWADCENRIAASERRLDAALRPYIASASSPSAALPERVAAFRLLVDKRRAEREEYAAVVERKKSAERILADAENRRKTILAEIARRESVAADARRRIGDRPVTPEAVAAARFRAESSRTDAARLEAAISAAKARLSEVLHLSKTIADLATRREKLVARLEADRGRAAKIAAIERELAPADKLVELLHPTALPTAIMRRGVTRLEGVINSALLEFGKSFAVRFDREDSYAISIVGADGSARPASTLSSGEAAIVAVAFWLGALSLFCGEVGFICLDEPTACLDESNRATLAEVLRATACKSDSSRQIICVTHDPQLRHAFDSSICLGTEHDDALPAGRSSRPARGDRLAV